MSGHKKDKVNLAEQGVVTEEALVAYLHNELSPEEKQELEKLLLNDPFAADALEGLKSSANQSAVTSSMSSLRKKVRERTGIKERKKLEVHWVTFAWAAVLIGLLIGIGFIMVNFLNKSTNKEDLAKMEKPAVEKTPVLKPADSASVSEKPVEVRSDTAVTNTGSFARLKDTTAPHAAANSVIITNKPQPATTGAIIVQGSNTSPNPGYAYTVNSSVTASANDVGAGRKQLYDEEKNKNSRREVADSIVTTVSAYKMTESTKAEKFKKEAKPAAKDLGTLQDDAMRSFNSGDYSTAGDDFDKILKAEPDNADALYFGGISDYINGKTNKSENNFDKLLKKGNKYTEGSKWYKANILLKKGKSEAAKAILQDLTNSNGSYKERAIKKLAEMGF